MWKFLNLSTLTPNDHKYPHSKSTKLKNVILLCVILTQRVLQIFSPIQPRDRWNVILAFWVIFVISPAPNIEFFRTGVMSEYVGSVNRVSINWLGSLIFNIKCVLQEHCSLIFCRSCRTLNWRSAILNIKFVLQEHCSLIFCRSCWTPNKCSSIFNVKFVLQEHWSLIFCRSRRAPNWCSSILNIKKCSPRTLFSDLL